MLCCNLWSSSGYISWIPLHCWNVSGADVWVVVDVAVEIIDVCFAAVVAVENVYVWVAVDVVVVAVEVASQNQRASSPMSVCTAAEEDVTGCRSTEPLGTTGPAAGSVFVAARPSALDGSAWCLLPPALFLHCLHRYV